MGYYQPDSLQGANNDNADNNIVSKSFHVGICANKKSLLISREASKYFYNIFYSIPSADVIITFTIIMEGIIDKFLMLL